MNVRPPAKFYKIAVTVAAFIISYFVWHEYQLAEVYLCNGGKAEFHQHGIFSSKSRSLYIFKHRWYLDGSELAVPFEVRYNDYRILRFESGGRAYVVDKTNFTRQELRFVEDEWCLDVDGDWVPISVYSEF